MEDRVTLFVGFLIEGKKKSGTVKSYISAMKAVLDIDGHPLNENRTILNVMTRACKLHNSSKVNIRFPIRKGLLHLITKEIDNYYENQPYLQILYKAMFVTAYYGLFRIGEITNSLHVVKAMNIHIGLNKNKLMFVLFSSKTHTPESKPQIIKISGDSRHSSVKASVQRTELYSCPFRLLKDYLHIRKAVVSQEEPFFIFHDRTPVEARNLRSVLRESLRAMNMDHSRYLVHGLRSGRALDLLKMGVSVETIKKLGRW